MDSPGRAELVIVGAGPAGVSGALWARTLGIELRVIEQAEEVGGQLGLVHFHLAELPGIARGNGPELAAIYAGQLEAGGMRAELGVEAESLEPSERGVAVRVAGGRIEAAAALVATGLRRRRLLVRGEAALAGAGLSCSARRDRGRFANRDIVVVGGGDGAYENALLLTAAGCRVLIVVRGRPRARAEFRARVAADPAIEVMEQARVVEILGAGEVEAVRIDHRGSLVTRAARGVVIKIGMAPNSEWCSNLARDAGGYLEVDARGRTSAPRVWAAGDVARPLRPSVAAAVGGGAIALADIRAALRGE